MTLYERFLRQAKMQIALQDLTQAEVGKAIGLSRNGISKALNGKVTLKGDKLLELAMLLKISLDEIIFPETDLVVNSMTTAQALARDGVPEEEILQGIRNSAHEVERTQLQAAHYNKLAKHVRDLGYHMPYFPETIEPKTVTWSGIDMEELKKACEKVGTVSVKNGMNGEWISMPVDEFFRMLSDHMMLEGKRWPEH